MVNWVMAVGVLIPVVVSAGPPAAAIPSGDVPPIQVVVAKRLLEQREEEVDVARAGLVISTLFDPATDVAAGLKMVDALDQSIKLHQQRLSCDATGPVQLLARPH